MKSYPWPNLIWQPLLATIFTGWILFFMGYFANSSVLWAVGAGSLSSSSYIIFSKPSTVPAAFKNILSGYLIGIITGITLHIIKMGFGYFNYGILDTPYSYIVEMMAASSVGLCLFIMALFKVEHPPAAGIALILVIDIYNYNEIIFIVIAALLLAVTHYCLRNKLVDLM